MLVTLAGIVTLSRELQLANAPFSSVTDGGIVTFLRFLQFENEPFPILVTLSGMDTLSRLSQPQNV